MGIACCNIELMEWDAFIAREGLEGILCFKNRNHNIILKLSSDYVKMRVRQTTDTPLNPDVRKCFAHVISLLLFKLPPPPPPDNGDLELSD